MQLAGVDRDRHASHTPCISLNLKKETGTPRCGMSRRLPGTMRLFFGSPPPLAFAYLLEPFELAHTSARNAPTPDSALPAGWTCSCCCCMTSWHSGCARRKGGYHPAVTYLTGSHNASARCTLAIIRPQPSHSPNATKVKTKKARKATIRPAA